MAVMTALLFTVLVVDLAQLSIQRREMLIGADAATRSAAPELMDRRWLYLGPEGEEFTHQKNDHLEHLLEHQAAAAIHQAALFASQNRVAGRPIELEDDGVTLGYVPDPTSGDPSMFSPPAGEACNSIEVALIRSKLKGNPPALWLARQTGWENIDVVVHSQACVDTRIHGFRPLEFVNVPMAPLGLFEHREEDEPHGHSHEHEDHHEDHPPRGETADDNELPAQLWWALGPQDHFAVDPKHGVVERREDGIAEMVFRLKGEHYQHDPKNEEDPENPPRPCAVVGPSPRHLEMDEFVRMAVLGLHAGDMSYLGGQITLSGEVPALLPCRFQPESDALNTIHDVLLSPRLYGRPRIWPVVADCSSAVGKPTVGVVGFVAGCVVDCGFEPDGSLRIVIQPCLLQTPTALTGRMAQRNPWIGKLLIVR